MANCLKGKVALVTGSGQGVGRGIAEYFAQQGAIVITNNRKRVEKRTPPEYVTKEERQKWLSLSGDAETVAERIKANGGIAEPYFCDVADYAATKKMIDYIVGKYGRIDIIVNNAAICEAGSLLDITERDWDLQTVVKMKGAFNCTKHAVPYMKEQGYGRIINIASDAWIGLGNAAAYSAANSGIVGFTKAISYELFRLGITCNAICPQAASPGHIAGFNKTLLTLSKNLGQEVKMSEEKRAQVEASHGDAKDLAPFLAYLSTEAASDITGEVFSVTASGRINVYTHNVCVNDIQKDGTPWTVEELEKSVPETLLKDYINLAKKTAY